MGEIKKKTNKKTKRSFRNSALALGISIISDALDYFAAPLFSIPIIGDVFDVITTWLLYSITKSKVSVIMNLAEFIPFVGDFLPVYTVSTLIWILREYGYESSIRKLLGLISNKL
jgi:fructose-specific phosphotransferase system IIC component